MLESLPPLLRRRNNRHNPNNSADADSEIGDDGLHTNVLMKTERGPEVNCDAAPAPDDKAPAYVVQQQKWPC
jgi:hypothetical protein